jgi:hypothetical protein
MLLPGNASLSNKAYQDYQYRELQARRFYILPSSNIKFLITILKAEEFTVKL